MTHFAQSKNVEASDAEVAKQTEVVDQTEALRAAFQEHLDVIQRDKSLMESFRIFEAVKDVHAQLGALLKNKSFMENIRQFQAAHAELQTQLDALQETKPLMERIRKLQSKADEIGKPDPTFDMKKFTDEMWGGA